MRRKGAFNLTCCALLALLLADCVLPKPPPAVVSGQNVVNTANAQTVVALSTELSASHPTFTSQPSATTQPTVGTDQPTPQGATPTLETPQPTAGTPSATLDPNAPCNRAEFVRDVTIPDESTIPPYSVFTKVWEIRNTGSCAWTKDYSIVFTGSGDSMRGKDPTPLIASGEVQPGQSVLAAVQMRSPENDGEYIGRWWLSAADGSNFGVGEKATGTIYVKIKVAEAYSFAEQFCSAQWSTGSAKLPCPKSDDPGQGSVVQVKDPALEDGAKSAGLALVVTPQQSPDGYLVGRFPAIKVPEKADFRATLSCAPEALGCYVKFKLTYTIEDGPEQTLGEWNEGFDGNTNEVAADLNALAGKDVAFNLYLYVNGEPAASKAIWFDPRITK